jgi:RecA-family ATPase
MSDDNITTLEDLVGDSSKTPDLSVTIDEIKRYFPYTRTNEDLIKDKELKLEWLVDGLLLEGGSSLVVAEPKTGKSVLARQLALAVSKGTKVLNRKAKQGVVFYISVEDHPALIKKHMLSIGSETTDKIIWSLGRISGASFQDAIRFICEKIHPSLIVIDTMFKVFRNNDINDYNSMVVSLQQVTEIVRKHDSHIMYIHHMNKGSTKKQSLDSVFGNTSIPKTSLNRIMGSTGIAGEMDSIIVLTKDEGENRYLDSSYSRCGDRISNELLYWDEKRECYLINDI